MKYYVALAITNSRDYYVYLYKNQPNHVEICKKVMESEKAGLDLEWYVETTSTTIYEREVENATG